jgi:hypothetical protein
MLHCAPMPEKQPSSGTEKSLRIRVREALDEFDTFPKQHISVAERSEMMRDMVVSVLQPEELHLTAVKQLVERAKEAFLRYQKYMTDDSREQRNAIIRDKAYAVLRYLRAAESVLESCHEESRRLKAFGKWGGKVEKVYEEFFAYNEAVSFSDERGVVVPPSEGLRMTFHCGEEDCGYIASGLPQRNLPQGDDPYDPHRLGA